MALNNNNVHRISTYDYLRLLHNNTRNCADKGHDRGSIPMAYALIARSRKNQIWGFLVLTKWASKQHSYVLENKTRRLKPLSTSTVMIMAPDQNRRHRITSTMPWRSRRAASGLRRPSESRALLAFVAIGQRLMCAVRGRDCWFSTSITHRSRSIRKIRRACTHTPESKEYMYICLELA